MIKDIVQIGEIEFHNLNVKVFHDPDRFNSELGCMWRARNPDSFYTGPTFLGNDGVITYPDDAVIPVNGA